jgi:formiminotetrahydrofolate cyclodeaminase
LHRLLILRKALQLRQRKASDVDSLSGYLDRLASSDPTPGGGSAATIVAAAGAALVAMAARITAGSPKHAEKRERALRIAQRADELRERLLLARDRDEAAFSAFMSARGDDRQTALREAAQAPLDAIALTLDVQRLAREALSLENPHLASDVGCAGEFASAAVEALAYNVRVNHRAMRDAAAVAEQSATLERYRRESATLLDELRNELR